MGESLIIAIGLVLVLEGIIPFLFPKQWRDAVVRIAQLADGQIRFFGLMAVLCGLAALVLSSLFF